MKNLFEIQKENSGYSMKITASRRDLLRAFINGYFEIDLTAETAASISNALYTPKPKTVRTPKTESAVTKKPRAPRKKTTPKKEEA